MPAIVSVSSLQCKHGVFILHSICLLFLWHRASKTINLWDEMVEALLLMVACNHKFVTHVLDKNKIKSSKPNFTALYLIEIGHERQIHGPPSNTCTSIIHWRIAASSFFFFFFFLNFRLMLGFQWRRLSGPLIPKIINKYMHYWARDLEQFLLLRNVATRWIFSFLSPNEF
jgi:hypothetical protein